MSLEADAVAVASGDLRVLDEADALQVAKENRGSPLPIADHRADGWCTVLFVIARSDGTWQTETVSVLEGVVQSGGGFARSDLPDREAVSVGEPLVLGEFRHSTETSQCLLAVEGMTADDGVRMCVDGAEVARTQVAPHGYFVLTAVAPEDATYKLGATPQE
jgi:hypothetical protein